MKQLIVMISMIMLGIAIAGLVSDFGDSAGTLAGKAMENMDNIIVEVPATDGTGGNGGA